MDSRRINEEAQRIASELISERPELEDIKNSDIQLICLSSTHTPKKGGKLVLGQCEKISEKYKWGIPCDFTITIFDKNIEGFTEEQLRILILHELLHIGIEDGRLFVKGHDLEDFKAIIDEFGTSWAEVR